MCFGLPGGPVVGGPPAGAGTWVGSLLWKDSTCFGELGPHTKTTEACALERESGHC